MLTFGAYNCRINTVALPVGKSGQTESYKDYDNGHYQKGVEWPDPRFTHTGDGTVTDNLTGLMWMKDANFIVACCPECEFVAAIPEEQGAVLWNEALDIVSGINNGT